MITLNNSEASLSKVHVNAVGGYLDLKSDHIESLVKAVDIAESTGWTSIVLAEFHEDGTLLRLEKLDCEGIDSYALKSALRRGDSASILSCNSSTEVSYSEGEYIPEEINDIPPPDLIEEEVVEEKPKSKGKKKIVDSKEDKE